MGSPDMQPAYANPPGCPRHRQGRPRHAPDHPASRGTRGAQCRSARHVRSSCLRAAASRSRNERPLCVELHRGRARAVSQARQGWCLRPKRRTLIEHATHVASKDRVLGRGGLQRAHGRAERSTPAPYEAASARWAGKQRGAPRSPPSGPICACEPGAEETTSMGPTCQIGSVASGAERLGAAERPRPRPRHYGRPDHAALA
jgi:hypothetical protein